MQVKNKSKKHKKHFIWSAQANTGSIKYSVRYYFDAVAFIDLLCR